MPVHVKIGTNVHAKIYNITPHTTYTQHKQHQTRQKHMHTTNQRHYLQIKELKLQTHIRQSDIFTMHEIKLTTSKTPKYKLIHNDRVFQKLG